VDAGLAGGADRGDRPRAKDSVLCDQRAVEVARDRGDVTGEVDRKRQPVDSTTY
jgi:hypothetical protein